MLPEEHSAFRIKMLGLDSDRDVARENLRQFWQELLEALRASAGTLPKGERRKMDATSAANLLCRFYGTELRVAEQSSRRVLYQIRSCPEYRAGEKLGLPWEKMCRQSFAFGVYADQAFVQGINSRLTLRLLRFRKSVEDACEFLLCYRT